MGIFSRQKTEDKKTAKTDPKSAPAEVKAEEKKASMKDLYSDGVQTSVKEGKTVKKERKYGRAYRILIKPLITEKAANVGSLNKYMFAVKKTANKIEVAKAINEVYGIMPDDVNIINVRGKKVRYGRIAGVRSDWKKAIITLPKGKTINIYEGV